MCFPTVQKGQRDLFGGNLLTQPRRQTSSRYPRHGVQGRVGTDLQHASDGRASGQGRGGLQLSARAGRVAGPGFRHGGAGVPGGLRADAGKRAGDPGAVQGEGDIAGNDSRNRAAVSRLRFHKPAVSAAPVHGMVIRHSSVLLPWERENAPLGHRGRYDRSWISARRGVVSLHPQVR